MSCSFFMIYYLHFAKKGATINKIRDRPFFNKYIFRTANAVLFYLFKKGEKNDKKY